METTDTSTPKAVFRLTVILPVVVALAVYSFIATSFKDLFAGISENNFLILLNLASVSMVVYIAAFLVLPKESFRNQPWVTLVERAILVLVPIAVAAFVGAVATAPDANPGAFLRGFATVMLVLAPLFLSFLALGILTIANLFFMKPIWWILGSPVHKDMSPDPAPGLQQSPVAQVNDDQNPRIQNYSFPWSNPKTGLDGLAGMPEFKTELTGYLQPFREYSSGKGLITDRNGILLSGPPGNGKTTIAELIAGELGLPIVKLGGQDLTSKWVNESTAVVKELFRQALEKPCVVFFDEFDSVAMNRGNSNMNAEDRKVVNALLSEIDKARKSRIVLIAATNHVEQIDTAIARDGRFDFRIEVPYPDQVAREAILRGFLKKFSVNAEDSTVRHVAELWVRRSVAFIESTVKRLRDSGKGIKGSVATTEDFKQASREASRRASAIPNSGAKLSEIALTSDVRRETDSLVYRLLHWEEIAERGGEPPSGVLLYGPPGTGKTNLVRALARQLGYWHVFEVNAADVLQDPRKFRDIMDLAANHRPAIVFIDEADELLRERNHSSAATATNEILKAMDGMMGKIPEIVFMAATNNPEVIDSAALRGGRFAEKIFMGRLTGDDLVTFLEKDFASKKKVQFAPDLTPRSLAEKLGESAPSDALGLLRKAINYTFGDQGVARPVCMADVDKAIQSMAL